MLRSRSQWRAHQKSARPREDSITAGYYPFHYPSLKNHPKMNLPFPLLLHTSSTLLSQPPWCVWRWCAHRGHRPAEPFGDGREGVCHDGAAAHQRPPEPHGALCRPAPRALHPGGPPAQGEPCQPEWGETPRGDERHQRFGRLRNKADYCLVIDRDDSRQQTTVFVDKVRFKHLGTRGECTLHYDPDGLGGLKPHIHWTNFNIRWVNEQGESRMVEEEERLQEARENKGQYRM